MRGRGTAKKYNECGYEWRGLQGKDSLHEGMIKTRGALYRFSAADLPISCRDSDWVLKLGPPLG
jgi:hypothetical protein